MTRDEFEYAIEELEARFAGLRIDDRNRLAYADTLRPFDGREIFAAIDTIARAGRPRPWPNEITAAIHTARPKARKDGPYLDDADATPPEEYPARVAAIRALATPTASTEGRNGV